MKLRSITDAYGLGTHSIQTHQYISYTCIVLYKVWIGFFRAVDSFYWKYGDWDHIEYMINIL